MRTRTWSGRRRKAAVVVVGLSLAGGMAVIARRRGWHGRHERPGNGVGHVPGRPGAAGISGAGVPTRPESRPEEPEVVQAVVG